METRVAEVADGVFQLSTHLEEPFSGGRPESRGAPPSR
jgi:hypothetical protein